MESHQIVGIAILGAGVMDVVMLPLLRKRMTDERQRNIVTIAMLSGAAMMITLGALFLTGLIPLG
jgi:hypothetical protein